MATRHLRDLYISNEALKDIKLWSVDQIDGQTRHDIYVATDMWNTKDLWIGGNFTVHFYSDDDFYI